jgi:hypothetical protein
MRVIIPPPMIVTRGALLGTAMAFSSDPHWAGVIYTAGSERVSILFCSTDAAHQRKKR